MFLHRARKPFRSIIKEYDFYYVKGQGLAGLLDVVAASGAVALGAILVAAIALLVWREIRLSF